MSRINLPPFLFFSKKFRDSPFIQSILIVKDNSRTKPLFSWYNPYEPTWVPANWFQETQKTLKYYFGK